MKLSRLYKCAIILILVVFVTSFLIEQADANRRRRRVQCNSTGTVTVNITYGTPSIDISNTFNLGGCCGVRGGQCVYVGPSGQTLLDEWARRYPANAKKVFGFIVEPGQGGPQRKADAYIACKCESNQKTIQYGTLSKTSTGLSFGPWQR